MNELNSSLSMTKRNDLMGPLLVFDASKGIDRTTRALQNGYTGVVADGRSFSRLQTVLSPRITKFVEPTRDPQLPRRLLVSRSKAHKNRFLNEEEVFGILKPLGFSKVTPDAMTFKEHSRVFQTADVIVSPSGPELGGLLFAPKTCAVFELIDEKTIKMSRFNENNAVQLGQHFESVLTKKLRTKVSPSITDYDFEVVAEKLLHQISAFLAQKN